MMCTWATSAPGVGPAEQSGVPVINEFRSAVSPTGSRWWCTSVRPCSSRTKTPSAAPRSTALVAVAESLRLLRVETAATDVAVCSRRLHCWLISVRSVVRAVSVSELTWLDSEPGSSNASSTAATVSGIARVAMTVRARRDCSDTPPPYPARSTAGTDQMVALPGGNRAVMTSDPHAVKRQLRAVLLPARRSRPPSVAAQKSRADKAAQLPEIAAASCLACYVA